MPGAARAGDVMPATPAPPQLGSYVLVRRIGSGGSAEVWLGRHAVSGGVAAVKVLASGARARSGAIERLRHEARIIARIVHPHVVPLFELGDDYVVMPYIDGTTLARRIGTPLMPAVAVRIVSQIAHALAHVHGHGVVHRDVKPSNILLDRNETAFLADFGVATTVDDPAGYGAGTLRYMAPEQIRRAPVGPAADQYGLALTLLEALGATLAADLSTSLGQLTPALPAALLAVIARATAFDPEARFPSMTAFVSALAGVDLAGLPAPRQRTVPCRAPDLHPWLTRPWRQEPITNTMTRGDYRVRALADAGLLDRAAVDALLADAGLADLGFSVYVDTARLGLLADPLVSARAGEVIALIHGWSSTRAVWRLLAPAVCRDNALALVVTPDLYGFGESTYAGRPTPAQVAPRACAETTMRLLRVLRLHDLPTVLAAHSGAAMGLLTYDDAELPPHVARVAITPLFLAHDPRLRRMFRSGAWIARTIGRIRWVRRALARRLARTVEMLTLARADHDAFIEAHLALPAAIAHRHLAAMSRLELRVGRQRRVVMISGLDDPLVRDPAMITRAAESLGLDRAHVHTLASGGHTPHLPLALRPEWTARNVDEIGRVIQSMLVTAHEPTRSPADSSTPTA